MGLNAAAEGGARSPVRGAGAARGRATVRIGRPAGDRSSATATPATWRSQVQCRAQRLALDGVVVMCVSQSAADASLSVAMAGPIVPRSIEQLENATLAWAKASSARVRSATRRLSLTAMGGILRLCNDRIDLVGIEGEQFPDREHLVVRPLVGPDGVLRAVLERVVRRLALERAGGFMARADEPLHLHVLARDVVDDGRHHVADMGFLELDRVPRVGDDFALELDLHAHARRLRRDAMLRVLFPAGTAVGAHGTLLFPVGLPDSQFPHSDSTLPPKPEKWPFQKRSSAMRRCSFVALRSPAASAPRPRCCSLRRRSSPSSRARAARWSKRRSFPRAAPARRLPAAGALSSFRPLLRARSIGSSIATRARCSRRARTARPRGSTGASASIRSAIR